ncbi:MAG: response regulator transcription factor [Firmicutes bacterium]|nr:response regulator transcription factor [Bacillota bacterium]
MKKILVLEDEDTIREFVVINLQRAGYTTTEAANGDEALRLFDEAGGAFDLALLDVMTPGIDGFTVCREIRRRSGTIGIIMLTARTQESDKVSSLMQGADDYVTKPFSPSELVARVEALYRRVAMQSSGKPFQNEIRSGEFVLNLHNRELMRSGVRVELTQLEFQIMELFFQNPGVLLSRSEILTRVWGGTYPGEEKIVDVNMRRLRMKIEDEPSAPRHIITVWGQGYRWEE